MQEEEKPESEQEEETTTARFVARILGWLLQGFSAKNKNVRFRCLHFVSELISHIGEIECVTVFITDALADVILARIPTHYCAKGYSSA